MIRRRVDSCAAFVVVMTPDADQSRWVKREVAQAELGDPIGRDVETVSGPSQGSVAVRE
jgi:hypothetical protein